MKSKIDLRVEKIAQWAATRSWKSLILLIFAPVFLAGIYRYFSGRDFISGFGDYAEITIEMAVLGGIGMYICRMIAQRTQMIQTLRDSEERYRQLFDVAPDPMIVHKHGKVLLANEAATKAIGMARDQDFMGMSLYDFIRPEDESAVREKLRMVEEEGVCLPVAEIQFIKSDGTVAYAEAASVPTSYEEQAAALSVGRDITERKLVEEALRDSEQRYRAVFNNAAVGINLLDRTGRFLHVNSATANMLGYSQEELQALTVFDVTHPEDTEASRMNLSSLVSGKIDSYRLEKRYVRKDKELLWADLFVSAIRDESGEHAVTLGVFVDITEHKLAEQEKETLRAQLLQAQKMEAIGTLASGIAHEFNNVLQVISGYAGLMLAERDPKSKESQDLDKILQASRRGADLARRLLTFGGKSAILPGPVDLNHEVEQVRHLLDRTIPETIDIELNLSHDLKTVEADSGQIRQVLMNLALNARDAMPDGGRLLIETKNATLRDGDSVAMTTGEYVAVTVSDTGVGMDERTLNRAFDPFYSSKGLACKEGLGLSVVHGIVQRHRGYIDCESKAGQGTAFKIYLPAVTKVQEMSTSI
jgi:two-component system, cell cycle sensor histidine kinase and response regulator CckA